MAAAAVVLFGFWVILVLAAAATLPAMASMAVQVLVQVLSVLPAALLAWWSVRRATALRLALLIPALLVFYVVMLNLMAFPQATR